MNMTRQIFLTRIFLFRTVSSVKCESPLTPPTFSVSFAELCFCANCRQLRQRQRTSGRLVGHIRVIKRLQECTWLDSRNCHFSSSSFSLEFIFSLYNTSKLMTTMIGNHNLIPELQKVYSGCQKLGTVIEESKIQVHRLLSFDPLTFSKKSSV